MNRAPSQGPIRVLVVDDSAFARKVVREVLEADARFEVVGIARDGLDALEKITDLSPDVVTLDLVMPNLDGLGVLRALGSLALPRPPAVVVVSMSAEDSDLAISALQIGAVDLVHKPTALATDRLYELSDELLSKVALAALAVPALRAGSVTMRAASSLAPTLVRTSRRILLIGASTGGPQAITRILSELPGDFPLPVAIVLHMPVGYTEALAHRLNGSSALEVVEASNGTELIAGRAVIARAGRHLKIVPGNPARVTLEISPLDKPHRPSVDVLFESGAEVFGASALGVVLTGMGDDGTKGARALVAAGSPVLTEAESSCVVYGMPRSVVEAGLSSGAIDLARMVDAIRRQP